MNLRFVALAFCNSTLSALPFCTTNDSCGSVNYEVIKIVRNICLFVFSLKLDANLLVCDTLEFFRHFFPGDRTTAKVSIDGMAQVITIYWHNAVNRDLGRR